MVSVANLNGQSISYESLKPFATKKDRLATRGSPSRSGLDSPMLAVEEDPSK
jgi:hypothetical protein